MRDRVASSRPRDVLWPRFNRAERKSIRALAESPNWRDRLRCADWLREGETEDGNADFSLAIAGRLIFDPCPSVWARALGHIGHFCVDAPGRAWPAVEALWATRSPTRRVCAACFILEHLLQYHFDDYFPRVKARVEAGDWKMREMLETCYRFGQAEVRSAEIDAVLAASEHLARRPAARPKP